MVVLSVLLPFLLPTPHAVALRFREFPKEPQISPVQWEWAKPTPQGHTLWAVAAGKGLVVAVGQQGTILTSSDGGATWNRQESGSPQT